MSGSVRNDLRTKLIAWTDAQWAKDNAIGQSAYTAQDSDHQTAAFTSHLAIGLAVYGDDTPNAVIALNRAWSSWIVGVNSNSDLPNLPMLEFFTRSRNGIPLPGYQYGMISDIWDMQVRR